MSDLDFDRLMAQILTHPRLEGLGRELRFAKGEHLFFQGELCRDVFCMRHGLVKLYFNTLEGKEWIKSFIADRGLLGSRISQALHHPSPFSALCLEETTVVRIPYDIFEEVCFSDMAMAQAIFRFTQWLGVRKELREYQLLCLSAEEGYREFIQSNPGLAVRLTQIDIARYLGITPIALSRIKKRITKGL